MTQPPESSFAFSYSIGTSRFLFDVVARSQAEAQMKVAAMAGAQCEGLIVPA
jgi:hypothetical protein